MNTLYIRPLALVLTIPLLLFAQSGILQEEQDFRFAQQLAEKELHDMAALQFSRFAQSYPTSLRAPEALFDAAQSYQKIDSTSKAAAIYLSLLLKFPDSPLVDRALFNRAELLAQAGDFVTAALSFDRLKLIAPASELVPLAQLNAARQYYLMDEYQKALDALYFLLEDYPTHPLRFEARYQIARIRKMQGKLNLALQELEKLSGEKLGDELFVNAALAKAEIFEISGRQSRADSVLLQVTQSPVENDSVGTAALVLADHLQLRGDFDAALDLIAKAMKKKVSNDIYAQLALLQGDVYYLKSDFNNAANSYSAVRFQQIPLETKMRLAFRKGFVEKALGRTDEAVESFRTVFSLIDSSSDDGFKTIAQKVLIETGRLMADNGRPLEAINFLRENLVKMDDPLRAQVLLAMANIQESSLSDFVGASRTYSTLLTLYPRSEVVDDAQVGLARCAEKEGDISAALTEYQRYLHQYPGADGYNEAAARLNYLKKFAPAQSRFADAAFNDLLTKNMMGAPAASLLLEWAEHQINTFHDYKKALHFLKQTLVASGNEGLDKPYILSRIAYSHYLLAEKNRHNGIEPAAIAHLDSARTSTEILANNFHSSFWTTVITTQFVDFALDQQPSQLDRISLLDSLSRTLNFEPPLDTLRQELELRLAQELLSFDRDSTDFALWLRANRLTQNLLTKSSSKRLREQALLLGSMINQQVAKNDSAIVLLENYLKEYQNGAHIAKVMFRLGNLYEQQQDLAKAVLYFKNVRERYFYSPWAEKALYRMARLLVRLGRVVEARQLLENSLRTRLKVQDRIFFDSFENEQTYWLWTQTYLTGEDTLLSLAALREFLVNNPKSGFRRDAMLELADRAHRSFKNELALGYYEELARTGSDTLAEIALVKAADIYFDNGEYQKAKEKYSSLKKGVRGELLKKVMLYEILSEYKLRNGNKAASLTKNFQKAFDDKNSMAKILYEEGMYYISTKSFKNAQKVFQTLRDKYKDVPDGPRGELGLARLYVILNKTDDALNTLTNITTKYNNPEIVAAAYLNLADFYYENRQIENSIFAARKVLDLVQIGPLRAQAMDLLINSYDDFRLYDRAIALQREYLRLYPDVKNRLNRKIKIGVFLYNMKEYERAIAYLRDLKPLADADSEPEIQYWIAKSYADRGDTEKSIIEYLKVKYLSKPTKLPWGDTALYEAGLGYKKIGNYPKAIKLLEQVVRERGATDQIGRFANQKIQEIKALIRQS